MNKLIVESKNDKIFIESIVRHLNNENSDINLEVDTPICRIDDFDCMDGLDERKLITKLEDALDDVRKRGISKLGILIDLDNSSENERLNLINASIKQAIFNKFEHDLTENISTINTFLQITIDENTTFQVACHFTNVDGQGELETVLRNIKNQNSAYADCLESWRECLINNDKNISNKDFDKFWLNNYIRFDTCSNQEQSQSFRKCSMQNFDFIMLTKSHIFNLNHPILTDLKSFLLLFN